LLLAANCASEEEVSMSHSRDLAEILRETQIDRRRLLQRAALLGVSLPVVGSLLTACGDDDDDDDPAAPGTTPAPTDDDDDDDVVDDDDDVETPEPDDDDDDDDVADTPDDDRYGGEIIVLGHHEIASLSPDDRGPTVHWTMITNIHDALVAINWLYEIENELAEEYEISDDGLEYTFHLRQGVLWHDGEQFDAEDVVYNLEFHRDPDNATVQGTLFRTIDTVEAIDDYTVLVTMENPNAAFMRTAAVVELVPEHHHSAIGEDAYKSDPIGTGPFMLEEYRPTDFTRLRAFEDHWRGRPYVDYFTERIIPEGSVRTIELQTGEADAIVWPPVIDDDLELYEDPNFRSYRVPTVSLNHFPLNNTHPVLSDKAIRQAMLYATDRQQVIDDVFLGAATIATANLAPSLEEWYNPDVKQYPYDPDMAEQVLEEAGWVMGGDGVRERDGERAHFVCTVITGDQARLPEAEVVQQYLAAVGIEMEIQEAPLATIQEGQRDGTTDASLYNWTYGGGNGEPDATATLHSEARNNWNLWRNDRVDELLAEGLQLVDPADRREVYNELQEIVAEEAPMLFMMFWDWFTHWSMRIQGLPDPDEILTTGSTLLLYVRDYWIEE
jgi:peptide/nickel transport system substrate-binding protein